MMVKVRLIRKLAERIDGVDLSDHAVGEVLDVPEHDMQLLVAEGWATPRERRTATAHDSPRRERRHKKSDVF